MPSRATASLALALLGAAAGIVLAAPAAASAQGHLVSSDPRDQAVLSVGPRGVRLTFSGVPVAAGSHVSVLDGGGADLATGPLVVRPGRIVWQPIAVEPPGDVVVAYHVELSNGSDASGVLRFSVGTGEPPAPLRAVIPTGGHTHGPDPVSAFLLVVDGLVVLGVLALLWLRRPVPP
ncbi:copper resistance CopC family protein [Plantactinospora soyae]|uniref:Methionine-rich copper-binding protein CopC n=1 Tax=Plantactinospora soyae TaxID=1544732 RepID=A0A927QY68_9ACTN|nr:copper resistance protein CopC [Plantactinospora soyae]MBE1487532.1 methionine-rich copper-binding protein CopC [Plantactinospora soyae]